ncbi:hypothetical protein [Asaia sp. VD9]|uniref:hypothetical protein n=1 Tax=Asaia sp. VD9 TaxID=3081235 RepID=UPI00301B18A9
MDGQELINEHQRPGTVIIFNLFLRIPVTVFGFLLWLQLLHIGFVLMSWSFYPAMLSATSDGGPGAFGAVAMLVIAAWLHWHLVKHSLEMCVRTMPRQIARWMGADADVGQAPDGASHMLAGLIERVAGGQQGLRQSGKKPAEKPTGGATSGEAGGSVSGGGAGAAAGAA